MTEQPPVRRKYTLDECRLIVQQMWPYLDGALSDHDRELVAEHVATCSACQPHFVFANSFLHALRLAQGASPDFASLQDKVVAALAAEGFMTPLQH